MAFLKFLVISVINFLHKPLELLDTDYNRKYFKTVGLYANVFHLEAHFQLSIRYFNFIHTLGHPEYTAHILYFVPKSRYQVFIHYYQGRIRYSDKFTYSITDQLWRFIVNYIFQNHHLMLNFAMHLNQNKSEYQWNFTKISHSW